MEFSQIDKASSKAFSRVDNMFPKNQDVQLYESLTPEAFDTLAKKYGADEIVRYIKEMEYQRMGGKNG
jgi:hypothetical protein